MRSFMYPILMMMLATSAGAEARYVSAASGTTVIDGPGNVYRAVERLQFGTKVDVEQVYQGYALINRPSGVQAWVPVSALSTRRPVPAAPKAVKVTQVEPYTSVVWTEQSALNMRSGPGLAHAVLGQCQKGDWVEVVATAGEWAEVRLADGAQGWVVQRYLTR